MLVKEEKAIVNKPFDKLKKIETYEATDGKKFVDQVIATNYQTQLDLADILGFTFEGDPQNMDKVTMQIMQNKDAIVKYFNNL